MPLMMELAELISVINVVLISGLLYMYLKIAWRNKSRFAIGLALFALLLLVHGSLSIYSYLTMAPSFGEAVLPYIFAVSLFEMGALTVLVRITL